MELIVVAIFVIILSVVIFIASFKAHPFVRNTYLFWIVFSLFFLNGWHTFGFVFPPILPYLISFHKKIFSFLDVPILFSLGCVFVLAAICLLFPKAYKRISKQLVPVLFNGLLLASFLISADYHKEVLMERVLVGHTPDCIYVNSFLTSVRYSGEEFQFVPHAIFTENGKMFFWSYSERIFFEGREELSRNFTCFNNRKILSDGSLVKI